MIHLFQNKNQKKNKKKKGGIAPFAPRLTFAKEFVLYSSVSLSGQLRNGIFSKKKKKKKKRGGGGRERRRQTLVNRALGPFFLQLKFPHLKVSV